MKIAVFGLGYVGMTAIGCLTKEGHSVLGVDVSETKVREVGLGHSPIAEPGLDELIADAAAKGLLTCTTNAVGELDDFDMALVCVGTPSGPDGSHNMSYIAQVSRQIAEAASSCRTKPLTVVYRSTIRPGTTHELIEPIFHSILGDLSGKVELVYNPEFLRESVAIADYFNPPKIVIGTENGCSNKNMELLNQNITAPTFYTGYREAEFTKFVDNSFHAVKVSFANEIGRICVNLGISARKVHEIFVSDTKLNVSPYYLRPGGAFGGSCLPKDVRALQYISADIGAHTHLVDSLLRSNEAHKHFLFEYATSGLEKGARVLLLGLAFKNNSDDLRESPNVDLARKLLQGGFKLSILDPALEPKKLIGQNLGYAYSNLPSLEQLLVSNEFAQTEQFDLVIDANGSARHLTLKAKKITKIDTLS